MLKVLLGFRAIVLHRASTPTRRTSLPIRRSDDTFSPEGRLFRWQFLAPELTISFLDRNETGERHPGLRF